MKRFYLFSLILVAVMLGACTRDVTLEQSGNGRSELTLRVELDDDTRAGFADGKYFWEGGEQLGLYVASAEPSLNIAAGVEVRDGRGYCTTSDVTFESGDEAYVYFPHSTANDTNDPADVTLAVPEVQVQNVAGEFDLENMPMVTAPVLLDASLQFHVVYLRPLGGFLRVNVCASGQYGDEKLRSVSFSDADTPLAGEFRVSLPDVGEEVLPEVSGLAKTKVTTILGEGCSLGTSQSDAASVYVVLAPGSYEGKLTVTTDKAAYSYDYSKTVVRNTYYDVNVDLSNCTDRTEASSEWTGTGTESDPYCIVTAQDLMRLSTLCNDEATKAEYNDKHYLQCADIDMSSIKTSIYAIGRTYNGSDYSFRGTYDGAGYRISNLAVANYYDGTADSPCGLFGSTDGAVIRNIRISDITLNGRGERVGSVVGYMRGGELSGCVLESDLLGCNIHFGGIVGYLEGGTVSGCEVKGTVKNITNTTVNGNTNWAITGGIAGIVEEGGKIVDCTLSGNVSTLGKRIGGIVAQLADGTVENCRVNSGSEVFANNHSVGGIVGYLQGTSLVKGCSVEGAIGNNSAYVGGIVGYFEGGTVEECVFGSAGTVSTYQYDSGGIAGVIYTNTRCIVDACASYGDVKGLYNVGGIVGLTQTTDTSGDVDIINCVYRGGELHATGCNSNYYSLLGGITGWLYTKGTTNIINCYAAPREMHVSSAATSTGFAGITGFQNSGSDCTITGCYSTVNKENIFVDGVPLSEASLSKSYYGGIYGKCTLEVDYSYLYYDSNIGIGPGYTTIVNLTNHQGLSPTLMTNGTLLRYLNTAVGVYNSSNTGLTAREWVAGSDGYPTLAGIAENPSPIVAAPKRVSVIGDSISTFRGYIEYGYPAHYPTTDGDVTLVKQTYWYKLIYDYMSNAKFDTNLSYSGSEVSRNALQTYGPCFFERFEEHGLGSPDIVLIHGGTNDYAHGVAALSTGYLIQGSAAPTESQMQALYDAAERDLSSLNDREFCSAYIKLICMIKQKYPNVKIVCIIGDYVSVGIQKSIKAIAEHYGARCVDLYAVNGFNDQTYMPKHDYNPDTGKGCHPGAVAMEFIAEKIYNELGAWLEE